MQFNFLNYFKSESCLSRNFLGIAQIDSNMKKYINNVYYF